jgi:hypothetical protein
MLRLSRDFGKREMLLRCIVAERRYRVPPFPANVKEAIRFVPATG